MKRAQAQHIMIFVIGLVVISLVLLFGYQTIADLNEDRCDVQRITFAQNFEQALDRNIRWGASQTVTLQAPCDTTHVCFVDRDLIDADIETREDANYSAGSDVDTSRIQTSVVSGDQTNVFTVSTEQSILPIQRYSTAAAPIQTTPVDEHSLDCVAVDDGNLRVRMQGTGSLVRITGVNT